MAEKKKKNPFQKLKEGLDDASTASLGFQIKKKKDNIDSKTSKPVAK